MTIHLEIPLTKYMPLAGAAALHGMDVATYAKTRSQASLPPPVADHAAATLAAASAEQPLPTAAPAIPEPPAAAATTPQPMNPTEEDALLAVLGA